MNADTAKNGASQSRSRTTGSSGTAGTADGRAGSAILRPFTPNHIAALEARGLDPELLARLGVGASDRLPGDCIGIPFLDQGVRVATKYRTISGEKRFTQDAGGRQILWNVDCLRDDTLALEPLIITEGELDAVAALQAGFPRTVSVPGGAPSTTVEGKGPKYAFLEEVEPLLRECKEIILAVDGDEPGANLLHDLSLRLGRHRCKWVQYPKGCKDLNDALRLFGVRGVQESIRRAQWLKVEGVYRMSELPPVDPPKAHDIGMVGLWEHYRMRLGDFCVVTGLPGHGKSSFVNEVCCRMAQREKWTTVFASFEQSPQVDHRRALRSFYAEKMERAMSPDERAAADEWIDRHFAFIVPGEDDDPTLAWILEKIAAAIIRFDANIVVIDPFNEMSNEDRPEGMSMTEYVGFAIKQFKKLAKKYRVHLILVAHPAKMLRSKDGTYPIPGLWDIADSAQFSNKADIGIVVHRENLVDADTTIRVVKSRYFNQIGKPGEIKGRWVEEKTRFLIVDDGAGMRAA